MDNNDDTTKPERNEQPDDSALSVSPCFEPPLTVRDDAALRIMCAVFPRIMDAAERYHGDRLKKEYFSQIDSAYQLADMFLEFRHSQNAEVSHGVRHERN